MTTKSGKSAGTTTSAAARGKSAANERQKLSEERLGELLRETAEAFRVELNDLEAQAYCEAWRLLGHVYGAERFQCGLRKAIAECRFFPKLEEIEQWIPRELTRWAPSDADRRARDESEGSAERWTLDALLGVYLTKPLPADMPADVPAYLDRLIARRPRLIYKLLRDRIESTGKPYFPPPEQRCSTCGGLGWARVFEGSTVAGNEIDELVGAVVRCPRCAGRPARPVEKVSAGDGKAAGAGA